MSVEPGARPSRVATRRWMVRLFETSDKLEEHLNKSNLRPDQVTSVSVDQDGFFVVVYWVGGGPPSDGDRRPFRTFEDRPRTFEDRPPRRRFEDDDEGGFRDDRPPREDRPYGRPPPRRDFGGGRDFGDRGGRDFPQRRPPRR